MRRLRGRREYLVFAVLCLTALAALNLPLRDQTELARRVNRAFLLPVLLVKRDVEGYLGLRDENARLRATLESRALEVAELRWTRVENLRLREALEFRERVPARLVAAEILSASGGRWPRTMLIDRGTRDGVTANLPVVTPDGLVGKTIEADRDATVVLTVRHPDFRASALALGGETAETGIAAATEEGELELVVPLRSEAGPGDAVVTSGIGPVFPRGIPLGIIAEVREDERLRLSKQDRLVPAVDLHRTAAVFVLVPGTDADGGPEAARSALFWPGASALPALAAGAAGVDSLAAADPTEAAP
jgi:rod shape-determining protein MreC